MEDLMASPTDLKIDRATRDLLRSDLRSDAVRLETVDVMIVRGEWQAAREALADASRLIDQLEQLGLEDDDEREHYQITADPEWFAEWLQRKHDDLKRDIAYEVRYLERVEAGKADYSFYGCGPEEAISSRRGYVAEQRSELKRIELLLGRLTPAGTRARPGGRRNAVVDQLAGSTY
jgi:hypothetical protein